MKPVYVDMFNVAYDRGHLGKVTWPGHFARIADSVNSALYVRVRTPIMGTINDATDLLKGGIDNAR